MSTLRNGLRDLTNPETGQPFTEDEIQIATQERSRFYVEAEAVDLIVASGQSRALYLADQVRPDRAATSFLRGFHGPLWGLVPLGATGGSGAVSAPAAVGTIFIGSTTVPDPAAHTARDPAGNLYQVLTTTVTPSGGVAALEMQGVSLGAGTNPEAGTILTWVNAPLGAEEEATVDATFSGGFDAESDVDFAKRILDRIKYRPASGNAAQAVAWARAASVAVETAFVYSCAFHAGSSLVVITQKRGVTAGPLARIPSVGTLATVTTFLVPPASAVMPGRPHIVVLPPVSVSTDLAFQLAMRKGTDGGWSDLTPWPGYTANISQVGTVSTQQDFEINSDTTLPNGVSSLSAPNAPRLMVWDDATSSWEELLVSTVDDSPGGGDYRVQLSSAPTKTIATGDYISPFTQQFDVIQQALEDYFDALGPGEVIDLTTDPLGVRAFRFPEPRDEWPSRAGQSAIVPITEALGAAISDALLDQITVSTPAVPADPIDGPNLLTMGKVAIYELP